MKKCDITEVAREIILELQVKIDGLEAKVVEQKQELDAFEEVFEASQLALDRLELGVLAMCSHERAVEELRRSIVGAVNVRRLIRRHDEK